MIFDHLGIVCNNIEAGKTFFKNVFKVKKWSPISMDPIQKVSVIFGWDASGICYELITPESDDSPIKKTLEARANILNHVCYRVKDLEKAREELRSNGCFPVTEPAPAVAFDGAKIQFFYSPLNFIIELLEDHSVGETI